MSVALKPEGRVKRVKEEGKVALEQQGVISIDLRGRVKGGASIEFLRAEVPERHRRLPSALIRYSLGGVEQTYGLRLDLDKRVVLDRFEDKEKQETVEEAVPEILKVLRSELYAR
jgi:hypothetical protein